jgi:hypothetical protein
MSSGYSQALRFRLAALALGAVVVLCGAVASPALAAFKKQTGDPLTIWIGDTGWFQELVAGNNDNSFFPTSEPEFSGGPVNAGFVLAFPSSQTGVHTDIANEVWGWTPNDNGPSFNHTFIPLSQSLWTGAGTTASPFTQETRYKITSDGTPTGTYLVEVIQTATYVNGDSNFVITYAVRNASLIHPLKFRALVGADLYLNDSDCGTGVFKTGPPRFVGGSNLGRVGGFTEATGPGSIPWTRYFEGWYGGPGSACDAPPLQGVWQYLEGAESGSGFPNTIDPSFVDNGVGIQWDTYFDSGLAGGATASFQLNTLGTVPGQLSLAPSSQSVTAGSPATLTATATDSSGAAAPGILVRFTASGASAAGGSATTNASGQAALSYTPTGAGTDTVSAFEDIDGNGVRGTGEPQATATVAVAASAPPPGSGGAGSADKTPPRLTLLVSSKVKLKKFLKGLSVGARVSEAASLKLELHGSIPKGKVKAKGFTKLLARQSLPTAGAGVRATRLRPSKKGVGKAKKFSVRLRVTATDRAGNKTVVTRTIKVR